MVEEIIAVIECLAGNEDAQSLAEIVNGTKLPVTVVGEHLDFLVQIHIFTCEPSYHSSDIGEMVYAFDANELAQQAFQCVLQKCCQIKEGEEGGDD